MSEPAMALERAPASIRRVAYRVADGQGVLGRIADRVRYRYRRDDIPRLPEQGNRHIRLVIGPANSAGQAYRWARAVEAFVPGSTALSIHGIGAGTFDAAVDVRVPVAVYQRAADWHEDLEALLARSSHVMWESGLPLLGRRYDSNVAREIGVLATHGVRGALMFHGSDIRPTVLHAAQSPWSPHRQVRTPHLEEIVQRNLTVATTVGVPVFVSTPDLLQWIPEAVWTPVVVDPAAWRSASAPREARARPVVAHAPSDRWLKGTEFIEPVLHRLAQEGVIEYRPTTGTPHGEMPAFYADADIVLDQFAIGSYGVGACEAMASGKLVMGHVDGFTREQVKDQTGRDVPIYQTTPDTLEDTLRRAALDPESFAAIRAAGPGFVDAVHDGQRAAMAMSRFLGVSA